MDFGDHEEQEVEEVLDEQIHRGKKEYLVKWRGLPREENTWEPRENLDDEHGINEQFQLYLDRHTIHLPCWMQKDLQPAEVRIVGKNAPMFPEALIQNLTDEDIGLCAGVMS